MNIEIFKEKTLEDYNRKFKEVKDSIDKIIKEKDKYTKFFYRMLNTDRMILYSIFGDIISVSQCSVIQNRDELAFLKSLTHFISYYLCDDGTCEIKWEKYNLEIGNKIECKPFQGNPKLTIDSDNSIEVETLNDILDYVEKRRKREKKEYIQY